MTPAEADVIARDYSRVILDMVTGAKTRERQFRGEAPAAKLIERKYCRLTLETCNRAP